MDLRARKVKVLHKKTITDLNNLPMLPSQQPWATFAYVYIVGVNGLLTKAVYRELFGESYDISQLGYSI